MHENDVELPSDEDEEFESTALGFQDKFRQLNGKFQEILMQESTVRKVSMISNSLLTYCELFIYSYNIAPLRSCKCNSL